MTPTQPPGDGSGPREWRTIPGYEGYYEVSSDGQVRSLTYPSRYGFRRRKTPHMLVQRLNKAGYYDLRLSKKTFKVHRLVLMAFAGPCPLDHEGAHNNGISTDNRIENLRWATKVENAADKIKHGTVRPLKGVNNPRAKLTEAQVKTIRADARRTYEIAKDYGLAWTTVNEIRRKKKWKHV